MILQAVDLETTQNFKLVNRYAKALVGSCRNYQVSIAKAHHLICAIHNFGAASLFTVLDVLNAVGSNSCSVCKCPAAMIVLVMTCSRCCYQCAKQDSVLSFISVSEALSRFRREGGFEKNQIAAIQYSFGPSVCRSDIHSKTLLWRGEYKSVQESNGSAVSEP